MSVIECIYYIILPIDHMQQIRLNKTKEVESALKLLRKKRYPILSDSEIIKLLLGHAYTNVLDEEIEVLDKEESKALSESLAEFKLGKRKEYGNVEDLIKDLNK